MILKRSDTQKNTVDIKASQQDTVSFTHGNFRKQAWAFCYDFFLAKWNDNIIYGK